jgi:hypothetical protein
MDWGTEGCLFLKRKVMMRPRGDVTRHGGAERAKRGAVVVKDGNGYPKPEYPTGFTR